MERYQKPIAVIALMLIFATWFLHNTKSDFPLIFKKDLLAHDESSNSVVAANITRKFFPPMVRVNPLNPEQGNWMEGPYWQHIPPLFAYVPDLFFKLDGQVTIEVKRLSYAFVTLLTGLLFIWGVYRFRKSILAAGAATIAAIFWINTPFTHELITGYAFGVSDIVLAFTVVCAFAATVWYLEGEREERINYPLWKLVLLSLIAALPIMTKNLLGAIPAATYFILLLHDSTTPSPSYSRRGTTASDSSPRIGEVRWGRFMVPVAVFIAFLLLYFLPLYFTAPQTFKNEILVSFLHFKQLEGWGRPWHWFITNYLPQRYLFGWTWVYFAGLVAGAAVLFKTKLKRKDKILLMLSGGWFIWNLVAISLVTSKLPNFSYQSYLLSLFFIVYSLALFCRPERSEGPYMGFFASLRMTITLGLVVAILAFGYEAVRFAQQFKFQRAQVYNYQSEHEKFYQLAEKLREQGINTQDLVVINNPPDDCWERYYILFLTGTESKTLLEMHFNALPYSKYRAIYYVGRDFMVKKITSRDLDGILTSNKNSIEFEIQRIKKDKTSCQWLVPDSILNAP